MVWYKFNFGIKLNEFSLMQIKFENGMQKITQICMQISLDKSETKFS